MRSQVKPAAAPRAAREAGLSRGAFRGAPISIRGLSKQYARHGHVDALTDLNLEIAAGEFTTLLGPSGAGKSTVLRLLAGLERPTAGQVLLDGRDVTHLPPQKRGMGVVFQNYALFPHMTVRDNLAFALRIRKEAPDLVEDRVQEALSMVQLEGLENRYPAQLSGGQQQRVAIARTLVFHPTVLLMDEPLGALDRMLRDHMQIELRALQQRLGITCVYVTHDQEEAMAVSDRVAVMSGGELQQVGTPREVYERPRGAFVAEFFGRANLIEGAVSHASETSCRVSVGRWTLEVGDVAPPPPLGADVLVNIRPERVCLRPPGGAGDLGPNRLPYEVESWRYAGAYVVAEGRVPDGFGLSVQLEATAANGLIGQRHAVVELPAAALALIRTEKGT